jgi:hypothetical protein
MAQTTFIFWLKVSNPFVITTPKPLASAGGFFIGVSNGKTGLGRASATVPVRTCRNWRITEGLV